MSVSVKEGPFTKQDFWFFKIYISITLAKIPTNNN